MQDSVMEILNTYTLRELQVWSARVIASQPATNNWVKQFRADHNSQDFYKNVILWYVKQYGCFPEDGGPAFSPKDFI